MKTSLSAWPTAKLRRLGVAGGALLLSLLTACGLVLLVDQPGLRAEYFALEAPWEGKPLGTGVGEPRLAGPAEVGAHLTTPVVFSIRWSGWWRVTQPGEHRFYLDVDDGGYLRIDDQAIVDIAATEGGGAASGRAVLRPGYHRIEIGLVQNYGDARMACYWVPPGADESAATSLPVADLYSGRPLLLRRLLRPFHPEWPRPYRQLLGVLLLLAGLSLLVELVPRWRQGLSAIERLRHELDRHHLRPALLAALFLAVFLLSFPHTGTVVGGDDTSYLDSATFNAKTWYVNRYGHVYLLKLFTLLSGGDPLVGVRVWWSFAMAATVSALALAVGSVGRGLQLRTLLVTLFVLLAQPTIWGLIGNGFADYSAMMFVTLAAATYLHGVELDRRRPPPRFEWHALAIGALTVGAYRSKEVGSVLLLLPVLFAISPGPSFDLRRTARKLAYWAVGAAAVLFLLMLLDGWILGDFFFTWDPNRLASLKRMNFPSGVGLRNASWLENLWEGRSMRLLWSGVAAAAVVAGARRRALELRLLHLLPIAFVLALIALYVRLPHPFSNRMLIPILPLACLMTGLLLHYAGLDEIPWRRLWKPRFLVPCGFGAAVVFLIVVPLQLGTLDPASLLPTTLLLRFGWRPEHFVIGVLVPAAVLAAFGGASLIAGRREGLVASLLLAFCVLFGPGFEATRSNLAANWNVQTGRLLLYPWRAFRDELNTRNARRVVLSPDLRGHYRMSGVTRASLARLALGRANISVDIARNLPKEAPAAIASRESYRAWVRELPALAATAKLGPAGFLVLVRPKEAFERVRRTGAGKPEESAAEPNVAERLEALRSSRDPATRDDLLRWILTTKWGDSGSGTDDLISLRGDEVRAVGLYGDGWTVGTKPAALLIDNRSPGPLRTKVVLSVGDESRALPVRVFVDDGEQVAEVRFDRPRPYPLELAPLEPFARRLILVWSDTSWATGGAKGRELGVQIRVPERR